MIFLTTDKAARRFSCLLAHNPQRNKFLLEATLREKSCLVPLFLTLSFNYSQVLLITFHFVPDYLLLARFGFHALCLNSICTIIPHTIQPFLLFLDCRFLNLPVMKRGKENADMASLTKPFRCWAVIGSASKLSWLSSYPKACTSHWFNSSIFCWRREVEWSIKIPASWSHFINLVGAWFEKYKSNTQACLYLPLWHQEIYRKDWG